MAFDYARMANLDTELQDAADQAALAAASQLDQTNGSIQRATAAAQSLLTNRTLMANDANVSGTAVTIPTVVFYPTKADAENNTNGFTDHNQFRQRQFRAGRGGRPPRALCADPDRRRVHVGRHFAPRRSRVSARRSARSRR